MVAQNILRAYEEKYFFFGSKKIRFVAVLDQNKLKNQITCAPLSELPSHISTLRITRPFYYFFQIEQNLPSVLFMKKKHGQPAHRSKTITK